MPKLVCWLRPSFSSPAGFGNSRRAAWVTGTVVWSKAVSGLGAQEVEVGKLWWDLLLVQPRLQSTYL